MGRDRARRWNNGRLDWQTKQVIGISADRPVNEHAKPNLLSREKLRRTIDGYRLSQVVYVAAELRIADLLQRAKWSLATEG